MPDFTVRGIDISMAERIKELARAKNWSINDVVLDLLQQGLRMNGAAPPDEAGTADHKDVALLAGTWASEEAAAFRAALEAFEQLPPDTPLTTR